MIPELLADVLSAAILTACASSPKQTAAVNDPAASCAPRAEDSTYARLGPVYRDCAVTTKAVFLTQNIAPEFRPPTQNVRSGACYSVELEYVVDEQGLVEANTARVVKTNNQAFAEAPVRQIVSDKRAMQTMVVVMPAGQKPSASARPPRATTSC